MSDHFTSQLLRQEARRVRGCERRGATRNYRSAGRKVRKFRLMNADGHMLLSIPLGRVHNKKDFLKIFQIDSK